MTVLVLGPEGTFSHELAYRVFGRDYILVPTIKQIFTGVEEGRHQGLIPLENSEAGGVGPSLDGLLRHPVFITGELFMPIHHHLAGFSRPDGIEVLYVHPQTHEQCSILIEELGVPVIHTPSNAASAKEAAASPGSAALVSMMAARIYKLPILRECVENNPQNITRFVTLAPGQNENGHYKKCSILVDPQEDRSGLLHDLLSVFADAGINLTRIESRPSKRGMGSYVFFIDLEYTPEVAGAINRLESMTRVKKLGCYNEIEVPEWKL